MDQQNNTNHYTNQLLNENCFENKNQNNETYQFYIDGHVQNPSKL